MTSTPKSANKHVTQECEGGSPSPLAGAGPGGHKPSFKSTKLARRARSFKDEFLEKLSQMRSPGGIGVRSASPKGRPAKDEADHAHHGKEQPPQAMASREKGPANEFDVLAKQIQVTLKHFMDVISKDKLEMLPGNGTIVLDTVWHINLLVKSSMGDDYSASVRSATHRMYQSVARLIKLCDDALLDASILEEKTVAEVVQLVEDAVKDLIRQCQERIAHAHKTPSRNSYANISVDLTTQRNSLPDIPLTPREREILEQTSRTPGMVRGSHSSESILRDSTPPPKPPLPNGGVTPPPPLPPKTRPRMQHLQRHLGHMEYDQFINSSLERVSLHSRSPEDSSSLLSASGGSMDSVLNQSREEEEISALMDQNVDDSDTALENDLHDIEDGNCYGSNGNCNWDDATDNCYVALANHRNDHHDHHHINHFQYNRLSNTDSGIVSIDSQSQRNSSCSKRSSQQSTHWKSSVTSTSTSTHEMTKSESVVQNLSQVVESSTTSSSISTMSKNSLMLALDDVDGGGVGGFDNGLPPAIPMKTRKTKERLPSPYDNVPVPESQLDGEIIVTCQMHQSQQSLSTSTSIASSICADNGKPPPLPPKKKHMFQSVAYSVMAYMEMFGNCSHNSDQEFMRHSMHVQWTPSPTPPGLPTTQSCSFAQHHTASRTSHSQMHSLTVAHPSGDSSPISSPMKSPNLPPTPQSAGVTGLPPALPPRKARNSYKSPPTTPLSSISVPELKTPVEPLPDLLENTPKSEDEEKEEDAELDLMEETEISKYLAVKKPEEEGYDIRGGTIDALIIQATKGSKSGYSYQEAFLTTYRTFVTPFDLVGKLIRRYNYFYCQPDKKPRSREAFALLVRVVNDLTSADLDATLQQKLMDFVQQLITGGELTLAKALRVKLIEKHIAKEQSERKDTHHSTLHTVGLLGSGSCTILDFKSEQIAEQMTLLDAELFQKIEIPEVLIWAQEQNEERSKNLTRFTEHFNKMSYWARTRILECDAKDREKYFMKFIKIMKHLRKINNFNSYLALLSALDSAPVRRLEWQKHVQEGLKEYCALIDSSSSFRAYRQALANASPPCIPYIGLVLQDLTFVHIGNSNLLANNYINFSKRWQQHNIVENMKEFKKCLSNSSTTYTFKKNDRIIAFFDNFGNFMSEDAMWQMSENIKPRAGKKTAI